MEPSKDQCFSYWLCCLLVYTSWKRICRIYFILVLDNIIYKIVFPYTTLSKGHQLWETDPKAASFQLPVGMYIFSPKFNKAFISLTVQHSLFIDFYTKLNIFSSVSEWDMSFYLEKLNCPFITDFLLDISDPACLKAYVVVIVMVFYHFVSILRDRSTNQETENLDSNAFHEVADEEQIFTISVLTLWQAFNKIFRNLWNPGREGSWVLRVLGFFCLSSLTQHVFALKGSAWITVSKAAFYFPSGNFRRQIAPFLWKD